MRPPGSDLVVAAALAAPRRLLSAAALMCLVLIAAVAVPAFAPDLAPGVSRITIDTDPERTLDPAHPARVRGSALADLHGTREMLPVIAVGDRPDAALEPQARAQIATIAGIGAGETRTDAEHALHGAIADEIAPPLDLLTADAPETVLREAFSNPMLKDILVSDDLSTLVIAVPLRSKSDAGRVAAAVEAQAAEMEGPLEWHVAGPAIAQQRFGTQMFIWMAIAAPLVPYRTVGMLIPAILLSAAAASLVGLGAVLALRASRTAIRLPAE